MGNGQKIRRDTLSMRIYWWQIITTKGVNNHYPLGKCKLESQWNHYTPPRRAKTKNEKLVTTVNIAEGTGPLKLLLNRT